MRKNTLCFQGEINFLYFSLISFKFWNVSSKTDSFIKKIACTLTAFLGSLNQKSMLQLCAVKCKLIVFYVVFNVNSTDNKVKSILNCLIEVILSNSSLIKDFMSTFSLLLIVEAIVVIVVVGSIRWYTHFFFHPALCLSQEISSILKPCATLKYSYPACLSMETHPLSDAMCNIHQKEYQIIFQSKQSG